MSVREKNPYIWSKEVSSETDSSFYFAYLTPQMVKNLPARQKTRGQSLGWEFLWRREWQSTPVLAWRILWTESPGGPQSMGSQGSDTTERLTHTHKKPALMHVFLVSENQMKTELARY